MADWFYKALAPVLGLVGIFVGAYLVRRKYRLETRKLEDEERERNLISRATLADIRKYDPKYEELQTRAERSSGTLYQLAERPRRRRWVIVMWFLIAVAVMFVVLTLLLLVRENP